ncbi:putative myosin-2 heavy chain [Sesbania bispinosa]|nr:putative myosin-2 heavy chain [Sesbania bispinosa]
MKYLRGTVVPHFSEIRDANETLEGEVSGLRASVELVGKDLKSYKAQNESLKTAKDKAEKSNTGLRTELKKVREDVAVRTTEVEAAKKEAGDHSAEIERMSKAGNSSSGMGKKEGANLVKESFENATTQVKLKNPGLSLNGMSHEFEVLHGHICQVDTEARKLYDVNTGDEVADWDED